MNIVEVRPANANAKGKGKGKGDKRLSSKSESAKQEKQEDDALEELFKSYPYKRYQHSRQFLDTKKLVKTYAGAFRRANIQTTIKASIQTKTQHAAAATASNKQEAGGKPILAAATALPFTLLSKVLGLACFSLQNFLALPAKDLALASCSCYPETRGFLYGKLYENILESIKAHAQAQAREQVAGQRYFLSAKIASGDKDAVKALTSHGFSYVAVESVFTKVFDEDYINHVCDPLLAEVQKQGYRFLRASEADSSELLTLVAENPYMNRYHLDENISEQAVARIYMETLSESFKNPLHHVLICRKGEELAGFLSVIQNENLKKFSLLAKDSKRAASGKRYDCSYSYGSLDYIIVNKTMRHRQVAQALCLAGLKKLFKKDKAVVSVKTLLDNYAAVNLLLKCQFSLSSSNVLLHQHLFS